jgi:hypothetical protein
MLPQQQMLCGHGTLLKENSMPQYPTNVSVKVAKSFYGVNVIPNAPIAGAPVVNAATFSISAPTTNGSAVGTVVASNTPTSWAIASGGAGYYAISSGGVITTTAAGVAGIGPGTDYLLISAINASGTGQAMITVEAA